MTEISEAAKLKACELANAVKGGRGTWAPGDVEESSGLHAFARYIEWASGRAKEVLAQGTLNARQIAVLETLVLPDPVDEFLIEARRIAAEVFLENEYKGAPFANGGYDHHAEVQIALAALKRGLELARQEGQP